MKAYCLLVSFMQCAFTGLVQRVHSTLPNISGNTFSEIYFAFISPSVLKNIEKLIFDLYLTIFEKHIFDFSNALFQPKISNMAK